MERGIKGNSGLTYALKYDAKVLKQGIGISKHEIYKRFGSKSPLIHSYSTFNRYMGIAKEFVNRAKEQGVNRLDKVQSDRSDPIILKVDEPYPQTFLFAAFPFFQMLSSICGG